MKFYQYTRRAQIALTFFWLCIGMYFYSFFVGRIHKRWEGLLWLFLAAIQLVTVWLNYWTVEEEGITQHGLFYHRYYSARGLKYAGTVRRSRLRWALKKSIEIDVAKSGYPRFVSVADRDGFLNALRRIAPDAEIVR